VGLVIVCLISVDSVGVEIWTVVIGLCMAGVVDGVDICIVVDVYGVAIDVD